MTPSKNRRKRDFANADVVYSKLTRVLEDLRSAAAIIGSDLLEPAIDAMTDKVDAAERVRDLARIACVEAKIEKAYGHWIARRPWSSDEDEEPDHEAEAAS